MSNLLKKHAKSFYWASFFLSKETFIKSSSLYNFCRTLDDIVDNNIKLEDKKENFLKFKKLFINFFIGFVSSINGFLSSSKIFQRFRT